MHWKAKPAQWPKTPSVLESTTTQFLLSALNRFVFSSCNYTISLVIKGLLNVQISSNRPVATVGLALLLPRTPYGSLMPSYSSLEPLAFPHSHLSPPAENNI